MQDGGHNHNNDEHIDYDHDFKFVHNHIDHLVDHPYDDKYYYDPQHHFIVHKHVVARTIEHNEHVFFASAHLELGTGELVHDDNDGSTTVDGGFPGASL
jgi:hypothetical protein